MSRIDKMAITGIRSFDPHDKMAIQFDTPLTLIVGTNGSGKTTIIECLKYMTCGELPPNSQSGRMFVHDPQMAGEKEVLGQVKMSFTSTQGARMVATRSLQLTVKQKSRSVKALEGSIRMVKDGERNVISSRVGEMNTMLPRCLGVSKAVLENVIFCHQEDSFWPMSTPQALKEKFDEIFEAQKYTKAIENIKILQKNHKIELQTLKNDEDHCRSNHEKARKAKESRFKLLANMEKLENEKKSHLRDLEEAQEKAQEFWEKMGEAELIVGKLTVKRGARDTRWDNIERLRENLTEMADTDAELKQMLDQHEERIKLYEIDLETQKEKYHDHEETVDRIRSKINSKGIELGGFETEKEGYKRQIEARKQLVRDTARQHSIRGFDLEIDDARTREFKDHMSRKARDHQAEWDRSRSENSDLLQTQQKALNELNERKSAKRQAKETSRKSINTYDQKISELRSQQNQIPYDEGSAATFEAQLQEAQDQLQKVKVEQQSATWDADIQSAEVDLRRLKERRGELEDELIEATRHAGDSANLDYLRKEMKTAQRSLETMKNAHGEKLAAAVGTGWMPSTLENEFQRTIHNATAQLTEAENQRNDTVRQTEYTLSKINEVSKDFETAQTDVQKHKAAIEKALDCRPEDYQKEMAILEQNRDNLGSDQGIYEFLQYSIQQAKEKDHCLLCQRNFKHKSSSGMSEQDAMLAQAQKLLLKYAPNANAESAEDLRQTEEDLQAGKDVSSDFDGWERLTQKVIPEKQSVLTDLQREHKRLVTESERQDSVVYEKQAAKAEVDSLSRTVQKMIKHHADIANYETQIQDHVAKQRDTGLLRGVEAIQSDKKQVDDENESASKRRADAVAARDKTVSRINNLELRCSNVKHNLASAEFQLKQKKSLRAQEDEYKDLVSGERESIKAADSEIQDIDTRLETEQAKYDDIKRRGNNQDRDMQDTTNKINTSLSKLSAADQEIQGYHDRGGDGRLTRCRQEIDIANTELSQTENEKREIGRTIKQLDDQVRSYDATKRSIADNRHYREDLREYNVLCDEIRDLEKENAEADKERFQREANRWQIRRNEAAKNEANVSGQLSTIDAQIQQAQRDWATDYAHAGRKFKEAHVKVETTKAAIDDLGRYWGALDKAIMKYHAMKMEQINSSAAELWRTTYQGTDVDTIMIRSESETVKANKSYNYRVCMMKQGTEMDMRGRCSAGQKMLASIIIRLALADSFGTTCGVIALDEPTTNLDKENIQALADSLAALIKKRRAQKNFQLIIITHDEEFLRQMNASEFTDSYYRVFRNAEQLSTIEMQSIADLK